MTRPPLYIRYPPLESMTIPLELYHILIRTSDPSPHPPLPCYLCVCEPDISVCWSLLSGDNYMSLWGIEGDVTPEWWLVRCTPLSLFHPETN